MLTYQVKEYFFDREKVLAAAGRSRAGLLSKAGAYVRRSARSSIRFRKRTSEAGQPPSAHSKNPVATIRNILFAYDQGSNSVVIGPVMLNLNQKQTRGTVPQLLEFGGQSGVLEAQWRDGTWHRVNRSRRRRAAGRVTRIRTSTYAARPFMGPALQANLAILPKFWANSLRGGD